MPDPIIGKISVGDGATFTPAVSNDGVISWSNNKNLENPASVDIPQAVIDRYQLAPIDSPALTGTPTAPTPASDDSSAKLATTAYVQAELQDYATLTELEDGYLPLAGGTMTGDIEFYNDLFLGSPPDNSNSSTKSIFAGLYANKNKPHNYGGISFVNDARTEEPKTLITAGDGTNRNYFTIFGNATGGVWYNGVCLTNGTFLTTRGVSTPNITNSTSNGITINAPAVSGYQFVCWFMSASINAVYGTYITNATSPSARVWWVGSTPTGSNINCWALYVRKW